MMMNEDKQYQWAMEVKELGFTYEDEVKPAISKVCFRVKRGEILVILGPSGCGKTTLCHCLAGIIPRSIDGKMRGEILLCGADRSGEKLHRLARTVGLVMQEPDHQLVAQAVEDELAFGPENMMEEPGQIAEKVTALCALMNLEALRLKNPMRLSGGEKQRLAIGGILALDPEILIFDEPTSSLDGESKTAFFDVIRGLRADGKTIIIVEHDFEQLDFADRWIVMKDGMVQGDGHPKQIMQTFGDAVCR